MLDAFENAHLKRGQIVQGKVLEMTEEALILDVGAKRDAIVPGKELSHLDDSILQDISIGDQFPVFVTNTSNFDDELLVSIERGLEQQDWDRAEAYLASGDMLELKVVGYNKGGLLVEFGRLTGFVPKSLVPDLPRGMSREEMRTIKSEMLGTLLALKVIEVNQPNKRLILSARTAGDSRRKERLQELQPGEVISGRVTNVVDFGVFVDLGGLDGLIHISRLAWDEIDHPSDLLQSGDEVEVLIESVDIERGRVSLNRKALIPNPLELFAEQFQPGDLIDGVVEAERDFGIFVKLTENITGLVHISELSTEVESSPETELNSGDEITVKILKIDPKRGRVSLSTKIEPE